MCTPDLHRSSPQAILSNSCCGCCRSSAEVKALEELSHFLLIRQLFPVARRLSSELAVKMHLIWSRSKADWLYQCCHVCSVRGRTQSSQKANLAQFLLFPSGENSIKNWLMLEFSSRINKFLMWWKWIVSEKQLGLLLCAGGKKRCLATLMRCLSYREGGDSEFPACLCFFNTIMNELTEGQFSQIGRDGVSTADFSSSWVMLRLPTNILGETWAHPFATTAGVRS